MMQLNINAHHVGIWENPDGLIVVGFDANGKVIEKKRYHRQRRTFEPIRAIFAGVFYADDYQEVGHDRLGG